MSRARGPCTTALVMLLLFVRADPATALDGLHTTATTIVEWHADNRDTSETNDQFLDVINRINLSFATGILQADLRMDTFTLVPIDPPGWPKEAPTGKKYSDDYRLERLAAVLKPSSAVKLTMGDFYAQFGNGIALSLRKVDELGLETVLRGGRLDLDLGMVGITLIGGVTNTNNLDPQDLYMVEDPLDRMAGLCADVKIPGDRLKFGVHGLWSQPSSGPARSEMSWIVGGNAEAVLVPGRLLMGLEFDYGWFQTLDDYTVQHPQRYRDPEEEGFGGGYHKGFATYLNLRAKLGPVSILGEAKWYDTFAVEGSLRYPNDPAPLFYNQPPTAERLDQEIENSHTVIGGRLKVDWRIIPSLTIFANIGGGDYVSVVDIIRHETDAWFTQDPLHLGQYLHVYGGLDLRWNLSRSSLSLSGGWRGERDPRMMSDMDQGWHEKKRLVHGEARLNLYISGPWTLHATFMHEWRMKREIGGDVLYHRGTHVVGVDWAGILSLSAALEYDTDPAFEYSGDRSGMYWDLWKFHGWGQVKWSIRPNLIWSVTGGTQRGGLKCVGGVCKTLPPFAGVRTELVFRY